jgi:hypothetical protein
MVAAATQTKAASQRRETLRIDKLLIAVNHLPLSTKGNLEGLASGGKWILSLVEPNDRGALLAIVEPRRASLTRRWFGLTAKEENRALPAHSRQA